MKFKFWAKQFCLNTGLHGYKFIVLPRRILLERVIWIIVVSISLITAVVLLSISKNAFDENPTTLVTDSIHHPIWNFPFPAVTVCSFNKISKERALEKAENLPNKLNYSDPEIADLFALLSLLYFNDGTTNNEKLLKLSQLLDHNELNLNELLRSLSPFCKDIIQKCKWKEEEKRCDTIFEKIITSEGHCCSFNYFAPKNHTFKGSYPGKAKTKPRHVSACGFQTSLEAIVNTNPNDYFAVDTIAYGNKVFIHSSYDYPDWSLQSYLVGMKRMALIGINPTVAYATTSIQSISIDKRLCYFEHEFPLRNFQSYSYQNCLTECRMNLSIEYCGCVPVIYINEYDQQGPLHRVCSIRDLACLDKYKQYIKSSMPGLNIEERERSSDFIWEPQDYPCRCLPNCEFVGYVFEASHGLLIRNYSNNNQRGLYGGITLVNQSVLRVFFNDLVGTKNRRDVLYNWQTYLAFYGGILGLFVGFSFISGIEFMYFTVKLITDTWTEIRPGKNKIKEKERNIARDDNDIKPYRGNRIREKNKKLDASRNWFLH